MLLLTEKESRASYGMNPGLIPVRIILRACSYPVGQLHVEMFVEV